MNKGIIVMALAALFTLPAMGQNNFKLGIDQSLGIGFGAGPTVFSSTSGVAEYTIADLFVVGAGAGIRFGLMTERYNLDTKKRNSNLEFDLPIFARAGVKYSIVSAKLDVGYSIGLLAFNLGSLLPGNAGVPKRFAGFFLEPHIDLTAGSHSLGVGLLLQNGSYQQKKTVTAADGSVSENVETLNRMIPALTLRYAHSF